ncbi:PREDICTED: uncharacterized protein LOC108609768 [Drosophila arizonae]|uniref:Uncharacterized protein LOC108609768 n=1 Tax=Drosophila arizonae TaxID=7263 RepID=A0ABM1NQ04_DROAR|nr:PREDICTED: uncharacterized protein LOC108609768 [Drosophila arizonae]
MNILQSVWLNILVLVAMSLSCDLIKVCSSQISPVIVTSCEPSGRVGVALTVHFDGPLLTRTLESSPAAGSWLQNICVLLQVFPTSVDFLLGAFQILKKVHI